MSEVTRIVSGPRTEDAYATGELLPLVYEELRKLAAIKLAQQPPGQTLQATALVHEAWLKLAGNESPLWKNRQHFFRAAAEAMRQILIDRARAKHRLKRGGNLARVDWEQVALAEDTEPEILLLVDEALQILAREHPEKAELVKLRFFVGLSVAETARALGVSEKTIKRQWLYARARLFQEISRLQSH